MALKKARQIANRARKQGQIVSVCRNREACDAHSPTRHPMCSDYVVVLVSPQGQYDAASYLWQ